MGVNQSMLFLNMAHSRNGKQLTLLQVTSIALSVFVEQEKKPAELKIIERSEKTLHFYTGVGRHLLQC